MYSSGSETVIGTEIYFWHAMYELDVHGSMRHNTNLIEMTNKMQLCRTIYCSTVP